MGEGQNLSLSHREIERRERLQEKRSVVKTGRFVEGGGLK